MKRLLCKWFGHRLVVSLLSLPCGQRCCDKYAFCTRCGAVRQVPAFRSWYCSVHDKGKVTK